MYVRSSGNQKGRTFIRRWIPQGARDVYNATTGRAIRFKGIYSRWEDAVRAANGYADDSLFQRIEAAALAVKNGMAAWEQDGVTHDHIPPDWPTLTCLSQVALAHAGELSVLDFGGALGSSYLQARAYLTSVKDMQWHIVEQPSVVASGHQNFQTAALHFHESVAACLAKAKPNVVMLSGVLQYLPKPYDLLKQLMATPIGYIIIDRHPQTLTRELLTVQSIPASLYRASYPAWLFDPSKTDSALSASFEKLCEWQGKDPPIRGFGGGHRIGAHYVGHFWRRKPA